MIWQDDKDEEKEVSLSLSLSLYIYIYIYIYIYTIKMNCPVLQMKVIDSTELVMREQRLQVA